MYTLHNQHKAKVHASRSFVAVAKGEKSKDVVVTALGPSAIDKGKQRLRAEAPLMLMV